MSNEELETIEKTLFILVAALRDFIAGTVAIDAEDKRAIAKFYDDRRGRGW